MSIFPDLPTTQWTKSVKSPLPLIWGDAEMASISGACGLAGSDATRCNRPNPISSHFGASNRSEEHTSELQSLMRISYAVFCLKKKNTKYRNTKQINIQQDQKP